MKIAEQSEKINTLGDKREVSKAGDLASAEEALALELLPGSTGHATSREITKVENPANGEAEVTSIGQLVSALQLEQNGEGKNKDNAIEKIREYQKSCVNGLGG